MKWNFAQSGIYKITNLINNKIYIGKSKNLYRRKYQHFGELNSNIHKNNYLQKSFNKYGSSCFTYSIIEYVNLENLGKREHYWIEYFKSWDRLFGYNIDRIDKDGNSIRSFNSIKSQKETSKNHPRKYKKGNLNPTSKIVYQ